MARKTEKLTIQSVFSPLESSTARKGEKDTAKYTIEPKTLATSTDSKKECKKARNPIPVSYTHLTLPTKA